MPAAPAFLSPGGVLEGGQRFPEQRPELPPGLQSKEEELQGVRDQLQQAQEERDCHLKTISNLKQVPCLPPPPTVPDTPRVSVQSPGLGR